MTSADDIRLWDAAADRYAQHVDGPHDSFYRRLSPFLWKQVGEVSGKRVLDLGCGHGWLADQLRAAGAEVTGIDGSAALVQRARRAYPDLTFLVHDLTSGLPRPLRTYDRVVAHMVLMDLPELDLLAADLRASLAPGGVFVFSILHPCFFTHTPVEDVAAGERYRKVTGYLNHERRWITPFGGHHHYHRPLSWYVDLLTNNGFVITGMDEPRTLPRRLDPETEWSDYERWFAGIPTMLAISCTPAPSGKPVR